MGGKIDSLRRRAIRSAIVGSVLLLSACCGTEEVETLTPKLYSSDAKERSQAAWSLARCGSNAEPAVQRLSELLYDENTGVQSAAAYALRKIDTPQARSIMRGIDERRRSRE